MPSSQIKKPNQKKRLLTLVLIGLSVIAIGGLVFVRLRDVKESTPPPAPADSAKSQVNLDPPTETDKQTAQDIKESQNQPQSTPSTGADGRRLVAPIITSADKNGAAAYIPGIFEEGGTCSATFTHDSDSITVTSAGFQNSNYTSCEPIRLSSPLNISGDWSVIVSYSSSVSTGRSEAFGPIKVN